MGNYKFKFSDMIPNAWFYKLKDMRSSRTKNHNTSHNHHHSTKQQKPTSNKFPPPQKSHISQTRRYSYYLSTQPNRENRYYNSPIHPKASDTHFTEIPRRLSTRTSKRKAVYKPSPNKSVSKSSSNCYCHAAVNSVWTDDESHRTIQSPDYFGSSSESSSEPDFHELIPSEFECDPKFANMKNEGCTRKIHDQKLDGFDFDMISEVELPPILTKPVKFDEGAKLKRSSSKVKEIQGQRSLTVKIVKEESIRTQKGNQRKVTPNSVRKASLSSTGIRLRGNSRRLRSKKKTRPCGRKSVSSSPSSCLKSKNRLLSESFAVVKTSVDPQRDFRESMMEMIVENNIRAAKDLEDLLACYLSLNSNEYHDLIVKAFEQIWFDMAHIKM